MRIQISKFIFISLAILTFCSHIPFSNSDPDPNISFSRGPNTDEGLYTSNIRNYIINGDFNFEKSDVPLKSPAFPWIFYLPFLVFGANLAVARITILLISLTIFSLIILLNQKYINFGIFFFIIGFTFYPLFHFSHFALADFPISIIILSTIILLDKAISKKKPKIIGIITTISMLIIIVLKFQFVYLFPFYPILLGLSALIFKENKIFYFKALIYSVLGMLILSIVYILLWYLPNIESFNNLILSQSENKFPEFSNILGVAWWNIKDIFLVRKNIILTLAFIGLCSSFIYNLKTKNVNQSKLFFITSLFTWLLFESHKLGMTYLPTRYLISIFIVIIAIISILSTEILTTKPSKFIQGFKIFVIFVLLIIIIQNTYRYISSIKHRTYYINETSKRIAHYNLGNTTAMGNWSSTFTWGTKIKTLPIIDGCYNFENIIVKYNPSLIIIENDSAHYYSDSLEYLTWTNNADSLTKDDYRQWEILYIWRIGISKNKKKQ